MIFYYRTRRIVFLCNEDDDEKTIEWTINITVKIFKQALGNADINFHSVYIRDTEKGYYISDVKLNLISGNFSIARSRA